MATTRRTGLVDQVIDQLRASVSAGEWPVDTRIPTEPALAETLGAAINMKVEGENTHHMIEACFKGVGRTLRQAFRITDTELPSTKGTL